MDTGTLYTPDGLAYAPDGTVRPVTPDEERAWLRAEREHDRIQDEGER